MEYIVEYLENEMNIHPIGEVTFEPCAEGEEVGYTIVIGGKTTTLDVWWSDYATWLEKKIKNLQDNKVNNKN